MTKTVLNTKISEVENKIPDTRSLVIKSVLNKKKSWKSSTNFLIMLNILLLKNLISEPQKILQQD